MARSKYTYRGYMRNLRFNRRPKGNGKLVEKTARPHGSKGEGKDDASGANTDVSVVEQTVA